MRKTLLLSASLAAMLVALPTPADAQNNKSFVSSTGNDSNACTRAAPCLGFQAAHDRTNSGGEINCLDSGPFFGPVSLTKPIAIDCEDTPATLLVSGTSAAITANASAGAVRIRNMSINGAAGGSIGIDGVGTLFVENCVIQNFTAGSVPLAIRFLPNFSGSQLIVSDTLIDTNGVAPSTGGGIQVFPQSGGTAGVVLNRVRFGFNVTAMALVGGSIGAVLRDSVVASSRNRGLWLAGSGSGISLSIERSSLINNLGFAVQASGANSLVRIGYSTVIGNAGGVNADTGAIVQSFKNNQIIGNGSDGTPLPAVPGPGGIPLQ